jgi:methyl-accepting chemotaxis protein
MSWFKRFLHQAAPAVVELGQRVGAELALKAGEVRRSIVATIGEVNRTTESETLAAGTALTHLVGRARSQLTDFRDLISSIRSDQGLTPAIAAHSSSLQQHVDELRRSVEENERQVRVTVKHVQTILTAVKEISKLTRESKILAINARIEAARGGAASSGFAVIAGDMQRLSNAVAAANESIQKVAAGMNKELPEMVKQSVALSHASGTFATEATESLAEIHRRGDVLEGALHHALESGDTTMAQIVDGLHTALSHLQFQDVCAQKLARIDWLLRDLEVEALTEAGDTEAAEQASQVLHDEIGGGAPPAEGTTAGEVMMF